MPTYFPARIYPRDQKRTKKIAGINYLYIIYDMKCRHVKLGICAKSYAM